jgi:hypothetical protein
LKQCCVRRNPWIWYFSLLFALSKVAQGAMLLACIQNLVWALFIWSSFSQLYLKIWYRVLLKVCPPHSTCFALHYSLSCRSPLWSSDQSSWLQIRRNRVRFPGTTRKKKVVSLERGPPSLVSITEELLGRNSSGSGLENREYGHRDSSRRPRGTLYPQKKKKLALTSLTNGGRSDGIVRLRTETTEFFFYFLFTIVVIWGHVVWIANSIVK